MDLIRLAVAFFLVFGLLFLLVFVTKSKRGRNPRASWPSFLPVANWRKPDFLDRKRTVTQPAFTVLQKTRITPTHQVHLLSIDSDRLLICTHPNGCTVLHQKSGGEAFFSEVEKACS